MGSPSDYLETSSVQSGEALDQAALNSIVQASTDCIKVLDLDARLLSMNTGGQRTMEIDDFSACQYLLWPDFWTGDDRLKVEAALDRAREGERTTFEGQTATMKGTVKWWDVQVAPVLNQDGAVRQLLAISRDITARKQAELALSALNAELERQVEERVRQLSLAAQGQQAFMAFTEAVGTQTDLGVLAEEAVKILQQHFSDASIGYYKRDQECWTALAWSDDLTPEQVAVITAGVSSDHPVIAEVLAAHEGVFDYTYLRAALVSPSTYRAVGSVPVTLGSEICGLLSVGFRTTPVWSEHDRQLLRSVARGLNLALERAAQTQQLQDERAALDAFAQFTEAVGTQNDLLALAGEAIATLRSRFPDAGVGYYAEEAGRWRALLWSDTVPADLVAQMRAGFPAETPMIAQVLRARQVTFTDARREHIEQSSKYSAVANYPLVLNGECHALLSVGRTTSARWQERDKAIVRAVGRGLNLAMERSEQAQRLETQNAELAAQTRALEGMAHLSAELALTTDRHTLIRRALDMVLSLLPDGYGAFCEQAGPLWQVAVRVGDGRNDALRALSNQGFPVGQTPSLDQPFETREPFFQDVYDPFLDVTPELVAQVHTIATLPLIVNGEVLGIFAVSLFDRHRWRAAERAMLITTVRSLGRVIEGSIGVAQLAEERRVLALTTAELEAFVYSASHDLRTPVRHVMSFAELTKKALVATPNEKVSRYLDVMHQAAVEMTGMIDAMLLLSRAGRQAVVLRPVDLQLVVTQIRGHLTAAVPERHIDWEVTALPTIISDLALLQQAMTQLLDNAVKFSSTRAAPRIQVWAEARGTGWAVFVRDNGVGFNPAYQHKLFGVFQHLHNDKQFGGVGVGLATVRRIVIKLGGEVFADGQLDHGATFGFTLPPRR
ncbi:ATP-binding protein [Deinococcus ruber]|uniref:histidine kinase n=1 Tax=Deinococcus ruber TaxID=1848197 RepID=A0A918CPX8_9DEIO|nr:GAF domain-containing protein [Deinococcus ruber]GGR32777.1 hypothetical protein GCM10008957_49040 [Deinococcus ruber]